MQPLILRRLLEQDDDQGLTLGQRREIGEASVQPQAIIHVSRAFAEVVAANPHPGMVVSRVVAEVVAANPAVMMQVSRLFAEVISPGYLYAAVFPPVRLRWQSIYGGAEDFDLPPRNRLLGRFAPPSRSAAPFLFIITG